MKEPRKKYDIQAVKSRIVFWLSENLKNGRVHYSIVAGHLRLPLDFVRNWARYIASIDNSLEYENGYFRRIIAQELTG